MLDETACVVGFGVIRGLAEAAEAAVGVDPQHVG